MHFLIAECLPNTLFAGLFEFLARYNFTAEESQPSDIEVAIDPEMLGKIFENLIDYNKQSGAFYTPREVVSFMAQSAILAHLERVLGVGAANSNLGGKLDGADGADGANPADKTTAANLSNSNLPNSNLPNSNSPAAALKSLVFGGVTDSAFVRQNAAAIKSALLGVKILDPAIGSGAFPMGVLLEIMQILTTLDKTLTNQDKAALKRRLIQECIYGLDIDADAIDIARLRFWLSIAVDEAAPQPLPNLDFKFMQGNSLLETLCGQKILTDTKPKNEFKNRCKLKKDLFGNDLIDGLLETSLFDDLEADGTSKQRELSRLLHDYFKCHDPAQKIDTKRRILEIMREFFNRNIRAAQKAVRELENWIDDELGSGKRAKTIAAHQAKIQQHKDYAAALRGLLADYERNNFASDKLFLYHFFFAEIMQNGGFDIVIGNPPYIRQEKIPQKAAILAAFKPSGFANSVADIYTYFFAKGLEVLRAGGVLSFITSNKFTRAGYGANLRALLLRHEITHFIDLNGVKVFDNATVDTAITSVRKVAAGGANGANSNLNGANGANSNLDSSLRASHRAQNDGVAQNSITYLPLNSFADFTKASHIADFLPRASAVPQASLRADAFIFAASDTLALKAKIEAIGTPLKEWDIAIYRGILTGYNDAFIIDSATKDEILRGCADDDERARTAALIKPILRGRDIKRYSYEWAGLWLINTHNGYESHGAKLPPIDIAHYPALKAFLDDFYPQLAKRADKGVTPYNLRNCAYICDFEKEKIVYPNMNKEFLATLDKSGFYTNQKCFFITSENENLAYLTGILNSNLNFWYFRQIGATLGAGGYEMSKIFVEKLPIPKITPQNQAIAEKIVHLVERILSLKSTTPKAPTRDLEAQIDTAVYALYALTPDEIALVEGN